MAFEYGTNLQAVTNALSDYNTTTSSPDLSANLTTRVRNIYRDDPEVVDLRGDIYPAVFCRVQSKEEEFAGVGPQTATGAGRYATVTYDVLGLYRKDGANTTHSNLMREMERLARNVEAVFDREFSLSGTALWCLPVSTEFVTPWTQDNVIVKGVRVSLQARYFYR